MIAPALLAAYDAQADLIEGWLCGLTDADLAQPSTLPGWRVAELAVHLAHVSTALADALAQPRPRRGTRPLSVAAYVGQYAAAAGEIASREIEAARDLTATDLCALFTVDRMRLRDAIAALGETDPVIAGRRGPIRTSDLLRTRVNELVVHSLDASASLDRKAVGVAVRMLAEVLAERHPGRNLEVRVPPFAAVQIGSVDGAGPTHTRGTPPNVIEVPPEVFVAVATGRRRFADAVVTGEISASGTRADLAPYLPLL